MSKIQNIFFDFGGVLLDLDIEKSFIELAHVLEIENNDLQLLIDKMMPYLMRYEVGEISSETFLWHVQKLSTIDVDPKDLIRAWNAMLLGWNPEKLKVLELLSSQFNVYLMSNTNELHLRWVMNDLDKNHGITDFNTRFFKKAYYSHLIKLRKPEQALFDFIIQDSGVDPAVSIFVDDAEQNAIAAGKAGFQAIHHPTNAPLDALFPLLEIEGLKL